MLQILLLELRTDVINFTQYLNRPKTRVSIGLLIYMPRYYLAYR
jgi:hypothetical protein